MDWITKLNEAVSYIEENLTGSVDCGKAAEIAECSTYHFQRMFAYLANTSLSEYIRRRKMSLAASDLQHGDKVLDVALRYGMNLRLRSTARSKPFTESPRLQ